MVWLDSVPGPVRLQVTPLLLESFVTEAVMARYAPGSSVWVMEGVNVIVIELLEQPVPKLAQTRMPIASDSKTLDCLMTFPW